MSKPNAAQIYSGPSGKFMPHVDFPRSEDQMGSLVVCLPHPHEGGQLAIRHGGREVAFDRASSSPSSVQWAAFFSDCEHEVLEVTSGHRLTLAHNLYWTSGGPMSMADTLNVLEPESLHFYASLRKLLDCPRFLPKGGLLGFTCSHAYPHTSYASATTLHKTLKGVDMLVYQALKRLAGSVRVSHALDDYLLREDYYEDSQDGASDTSQTAPPYTTPATIGTSIRGPIVVDGFFDDGYPNPEDLRYDKEIVGGVRWNVEFAFTRDRLIWLNQSPRKTTPQELAAAYVEYGNEPGMNLYYSSAVILADFRKSPTTE